MLSHDRNTDPILGKTNIELVNASINVDVSSCNSISKKIGASVKPNHPLPILSIEAPVKALHSDT
jgi:hypothetical protein